MPGSLLSGRSQLPLAGLVVLDVALAIGCADLARFLRFGTFIDVERQLSLFTVVYLQSLLVVVFSFAVGVYQPWRGRPLPERFAKVLLAWALSFTALVTFLVMTKSTEQYSRIWLGIWISLGLTLPVLIRGVCYWQLGRLRARGRNQRHVLMIGCGENYERVKLIFGKGNRHGFILDTVIELRDRDQTLETLEQILSSGRRFDECWLCLPLSRSSVVQPVTFALRHHALNIRYMPGLRDLPLLNHKVTMIGGVLSLDVSCSPMAGADQLLKRLEDLVLGSVILVLIIPVMLLVALAVRLSSPGPVLFSQHRHGAGGEKVLVYKFRSMMVHQEAGAALTQAVRGDSRVTAVGAFLRKTSLDELPQFINVLQGRLSIVGPRPHALEHNEYYKDLVASYMKRHNVKPGITGLAQVRGYRGETDTLEKMQRRVECDLEYINQWSIWLDLKIIATTVVKGFVNPNAY